MPPKTRSFSAVVSTPKPHEVTPHDIIDLQEKYLKLHEENMKLKSRITELESKMEQFMSEAGKAIAKTVMEECIIATPLATKVKEIVTETFDLEMENKVETQVHLELKEQKLRDDNGLKLRLCGMHHDWYVEEDTFDETLAKLSESFQEIEWERPRTIDRYGNHAVLTFQDREDRLKVLRQARNLKGTKKWISEELTKTQLKQRAEELKKVREARQSGKWAVYREGRAVIRDFLKRSDAAS